MNKPEESHSSGPCYVVEARVAHEQLPREVVGQLLDSQWRRVGFQQASAPCGVPNNLWARDVARMGYYGYESAMALAYWLAAEAALGSRVEIRLVEYKYECSHRVERVFEEAPIQNGVDAIQARRKSSV